MAALLNKHSMMRRLAFIIIAFFLITLVLRMSFNGSIWRPEMDYEPWVEPEMSYEDGYVQHKPELVAPPQPQSEPVKTTPRSRLAVEMQEYLNWKPPVEIKDHYPPYDQYATRDYDPNRWETFQP